MKEDQTQLINARLELLQYMMDSGNMPLFRHRSDMFLFALEAHNIARSLSSRYYRISEDLDIRFFIRFRFDYWLEQVKRWIQQLNGAEYRVENIDFYPEGRAKRLTIIVDRLFGYHLDQLPIDSVEGSMRLPDEEILEPFKAISQMKSSSLVISFQQALQEVYKYLLNLAMLPLAWSESERKCALTDYFDDFSQKDYVQTELNNYKYFCKMPDGKSVRGQFCYLKQRLFVLAANGELAHLSLSKSNESVLQDKLHKLFDKEETNPSEDQIPYNSGSMADDGLFVKSLYFVHLDDNNSFLDLDVDIVFNYLTRKDVFLSEMQEQNLQALFALMQAMRQYFTPIIERRVSCSRDGEKMQERISTVMTNIRRYNSKLATLMSYGHEVKELDYFFERLFSPELRELFGNAQYDLLLLLEKGHTGIKLETYVHLLRAIHNQLKLFVKKTQFGQEIYNCLKGESVVEGVNGDTVHSYYTKTDYRTKENWKRAITLLEAIENEYKRA